jgi:hypothetical protein
MDRYKHVFIWDDTGRPIDINYSLVDDDCCKYCNRTVYAMSGEERIPAQERSKFEIFMNEKFPCLTKNEYIIKKLLE